MSDMQAGHSQTPVDDEIDLKELFMVLWSGKWLITAITGIAAVDVGRDRANASQYLHGKCLVSAGRTVGWRYECADAAIWWARKFGRCFAPRWRGGSERNLGMALMKSRGFIGDFVSGANSS